MALPRLDYQAPDYAGQIGQALGGAAKTVNDWSPAPAIVQKYAKFVQSGQMSGREAAVRAMLESGGHLPSGGGVPDAGGGQAPAGGYGTPSTPAGPSPAASFSQPQSDFGSAWRSMGKGGSEMVSQPRLPESTFPPEDITVTAPQQQSAQPSPPPPELPDSAPILNKDVPALMQIGGQMQRHDPMETWIKLQQLGFRGQELQEKFREFEALQPGRDARMEATKAQTANIPFKNQMAQGNLGARWAGVDVARGNLQSRQAEQYLKGTNDTAVPIAQLDNLIGAARTPGIAPGSDDYIARQVQRIANAIPFGVGKALGTSIGVVADANLTPEQRNFRRQVALAVAPFQHMLVGSQITAGERELVDMLTGQQMSVEDTISALTALRQSMGARQQRYQNAFPGAAQQIGQPSAQGIFSPRQPAYPTDSNQMPPMLPGPPGPSLEETLRGGQ